MCIDKRYILAPGTQVREEDFGLLFYTMDGPRLFFLSSRELLGKSFFGGDQTLDQWMKTHKGKLCVSVSRIRELSITLDQLREKGVIIER